MITIDRSKVVDNVIVVKRTADLPFAIDYNERGLIVGMTGTGKTTLARELIADKYNLIVIDPKHRFYTRQDSIVCYSLHEVDTASQDKRVRQHGAAIIYRPDEEGCKKENMQVLFAWILARHNTFVYIDEIFAITRNAMDFPDALRGIHTRGRELNIGILNATQRPSGIPIFIFTETDKWYKFPLQNPDDNIRMGEFIGRQILEPRNYPEESVHESLHTFYYYRTGTRVAPYPYELDLT